MLQQNLQQQVRVERIALGAARIESLAKFGGHLGIDRIQHQVVVRQLGVEQRTTALLQNDGDLALLSGHELDQLLEGQRRLVDVGPYGSGHWFRYDFNVSVGALAEVRMDGRDGRRQILLPDMMRGVP